MSLHYADDWLTVYHGDCREVMASMEPDSVHCVVTSPPYWGLRDYGTATWIGGDEGCDHRDHSKHQTQGHNSAALGRTVFADGSNRNDNFKSTCPRCGATRQDSQLGLEPTPEEYVANLVAVFREVRRVLRADGTVWLNLGDSYAAGGSSGAGESKASSGLNHGRGVTLGQAGNEMQRRAPVPFGFKPKDLVGIPWRVAFALQADGWYLRSDIIWAKPNSMPESVTDRPTKSHEYIFLLSKSARYYFDADAVREPHRWQDPELLATNAQARQGLRLAERRAAGDMTAVREQPPIGREKGRGKNGNAESEFSASPAGRNIRSVWTMATQPYPGAHFATFPEQLPERCIKAGCPPAGKRCDCDTPILTPLGSGEIDDPSFTTGRAGYNRPRRDDEGRRPITRREQRDYARQLRESPHRAEMASAAGEAFAHYIRTDASGARPIPPSLLAEWRSRGWLVEPEPCSHPIEPAGVVLDPFAGSGTTGMVAQSLSRRAVLIDLSLDYLGQLMARNADIPLGLGA